MFFALLEIVAEGNFTAFIKDDSYLGKIIVKLRLITVFVGMYRMGEQEKYDCHVLL